MHAMYKRNRIFSLVVWNLLLCVSAAPLATRVAAQVSANVSADQQAQIEKGRKVVAQVCATCHTTIVRMVQVHKQSPEQWKDTVYFMISRGAQIMPDEVEPVTAYLAAASASGPQTITETSVGGRPGARGAGQQTPEGDGAAILQRTCRQCHELATATTKLASEDWNAVIGKMKSYGVRLTPADQQKLVDYLNGLAK
jgi:cytochrome c5